MTYQNPGSYRDFFASSMNYFRNSFFYSYLGLLCWLPIPLASKSNLAQIFFVVLLSLLCCLCCSDSLFYKKSSIPSAARKAVPVYVLFVLYLFWIAFQILPLPNNWIFVLSPVRIQFPNIDQQVSHLTLSFHPASSWHHLLLGIGYMELFVLTLMLVDTQHRLKQLLYTLLILGSVQAIYGSFMTLSGIEKQLWFDKEAHIGVATGTLLNRNHFANYLTYGIAAGIGLLLSFPSAIRPHTWREWIRSLTNWLLSAKGFVRLSVIIMVIGLILTRSRMGSTAFLGSLTIAGLIWLTLSRNLNRATLILFASLLFVDIALMGSWFGANKIIDRIEKTNSETDMRNHMLPYMETMANDFWIAGTGAGTFADTFPLYKKQLTTFWYNEAHSDYLQFFIEDGVIGMTPLLLIVLFALVKTIQTIRNRHAKLLVATGFSLLMGLTATGIHATVEYMLQRPATASLFVLFLALPWVTAHMGSESTSQRRPSKHT